MAALRYWRLVNLGVITLHKSVVCQSGPDTLYGKIAYIREAELGVEILSVVRRFVRYGKEWAWEEQIHG